MEFEKQIIQKYKFVVLKAPYELMDHEIVQRIFPKVVQLKTTGYRQEYQKEILPLDSSDFVATHLLMCEQTLHGPRPVLGMKSVSLKKCDDHRITFPMLGMVESSDGNPGPRDAVQSILGRYRANSASEKIAYNGSFTILPKLREDKALMKYLWEVSFSLMTNYYLDEGIEHVLAVCSKKFKVNKKKEENGWNYIQHGDGVLSEYLCRALFDAPFVPMELKTSNELCHQSALRFKEMWLSRIVLDLETLEEKKVAA